LAGGTTPTLIGLEAKTTVSLYNSSTIDHLTRVAERLSLRKIP